MTKSVIKILEPRYRDRRVLVARWRIPAGGDIVVSIQRGSYTGLYKATSEVIAKSPIEPFTAKSGAVFQVRAISVDDLVRINNEDL